MNEYKYLIIGGGMTADSAVRGIRALDPAGSIGMMSAEIDPPYNRPPLSKKLWQGKPIESVWRNTEDNRVDLHLHTKIVYLNVDRLTARDEQGNEYSGEKILLATGGSPRHLDFGGDDIIYYRTLNDYRLLSGLTTINQNFVVIGGGFIGSEVAAALAMHNKKVTMIFPEDGIGARVYPHDLSQYITNYFREKGVEILTGAQVTNFERRGRHYILNISGGHEFLTDGVIAGIGIEPNIELAKAAGLQTGNGIIVDEYLRTSQPNIYAAGDVAEFYNPALDKRMRVEHEDNANNMGLLAGRNMAGASGTYDHLPFFYSDLFDLGYEAVGQLDSRLATVADWTDPFRKGIVYYLKDDRVVGVLLWDVWKKVQAARELIARHAPVQVEALAAGSGPSWKIEY